MIEPLQAHHRPGLLVLHDAHRDRLPLGAGAHLDREVVLEVWADPGQVVHRRDPGLPQRTGVTDPGQLQDLGGLERTRRQDDLARPHVVFGAVLRAHTDTGRATAVEEHGVHRRSGAHFQIASASDRGDICLRRRDPTAPTRGPVERGESFRCGVQIVDPLVSGLLCRREKRVEQRIVRGTALQVQRPATAAPGAGVGIGDLLQTAEVRLAVRPVPLRRPALRRPPVEVSGMAAGVDRPVDAARAADHPAGWPGCMSTRSPSPGSGSAAISQSWLRLPTA